MGFSRSFSGDPNEMPEQFCKRAQDGSREDAVLEAVNASLPQLVALLGSGVRVVNVSAYGVVNAEPGGDVVSIAIATAPNPSDPA